jgi:hypothetical protein
MSLFCAAFFMLAGPAIVCRKKLPEKISVSLFVVVVSVNKIVAAATI